MNKQLILLFSLLLLIQTSQAQLIDYRKRIDSLKRDFLSLDNDATKEKKGNLYFQLSLTYLYLDVDSAHMFANEGIKYAQAINYGMLEGRMLLAKAGILKTMGEYNSALTTYDQAVKTALAAKDSIAAASAINDKSVCLQSLNKFEDAKIGYEQAIELFKILGEEDMTGMSYGTLSLLNYKLSNFNEAIKCANKSIQILQKHNYPNFLNQPLNVLGNIAKAKKEYHTAEKYYMHILELAKKSNDNSTVTDMNVKLGGLAQLRKNYDLATNYYQRAIDLSINLGKPQFKILALIELAKLNMIQNQYQHAEELLRRAENLALKDGETESLAYLHLNYGKLYSLKKQHKLAKEYLKKSLQKGLKIPYYNCSETYKSLQKEIGEKTFQELYPNANHYLDSIKQLDNKLALIPFAYQVADLNQAGKSGRKQENTQSEKNDNYWYLLLFPAFISIGYYSITRRKKQVNMNETIHQASPFSMHHLHIFKEDYSVQNLSSTYLKFDKIINQKLLLNKKLYLDVNESTAQALSNKTSGKYSVSQIRNGFKAIKAESFNDYKFKLRVSDFINELIKNKIDKNFNPVDSNYFGLDSDRQVSIVTNAICGVKLTSYKKLIDITSAFISQHQNDLSDLLQSYKPIEIHSSLLRLEILKEINPENKSQDSLKEQNELINDYIRNYKLKQEQHLKYLNTRNANFHLISDLYLSALYFWLTNKKKYPITFIQELTSIFWGFHLEENSILHFKNSIHSKS